MYTQEVIITIINKAKLSLDLVGDRILVGLNPNTSWKPLNPDCHKITNDLEKWVFNVKFFKAY